MDPISDADFLKYAVRAIVEFPEDIRIERTTDDLGVLLTLHTNQKDIGRVIGKHGITAQAIRTILKTIGARNNARVNMKIVDPLHSVPFDSDLTRF